MKSEKAYDDSSLVLSAYVDKDDSFIESGVEQTVDSDTTKNTPETTPRSDDNSHYEQSKFETDLTIEKSVQTDQVNWIYRDGYQEKQVQTESNNLQSVETQVVYSALS